MTLFLVYGNRLFFIRVVLLAVLGRIIRSFRGIFDEITRELMLLREMLVGRSANPTSSALCGEGPT